MSRLLYRIGHFSGRHPWRVLAAWLLIVVSVFLETHRCRFALDSPHRLEINRIQRGWSQV